MLQTLFEWDFMPVEKKSGEHKESEVISEILKRNLKEFMPEATDDAFVHSLIDQILKNRTVIDEVIEKAAPDWPIDKISIVDRNILRIGLCELLFGNRVQVPPKVAINESIELAKSFGGENSSKFVNGVLGAVYKELGEPDKEQKTKTKDKNFGEPVDISTLPVERKGGALVYAVRQGAQGSEIFFALVHDVFGYWTLSKGGIEEGENEEQATIREIKEEIGLDVVIKEKLGQNEYVANHPVNGRSLKRVVYFLAESEYKELVLEDSTGLDNARWFSLSALAELRIYNDILPIIKKAVEIISNNTNK